MKFLDNVKFVLTDSQFSSLDRIEYLAFLISCFISISLLLYSLWTSLSINYIGAIIFLILLIRIKNFYKKFVFPFNQKIGQKYAEDEQRRSEYIYSLTTESLAAFAKSDIILGLLPIIFILFVLLSIFILVKIGIPLNVVLICVVLEFLLFVILYIRVYRKIWKPVWELQKKAPREFKKPLSFQIIIGAIILILVTGFVLLRYKALTGQDLLQKFEISRNIKNTLPQDKYVVIQFATLNDSDVLLKQNLIDDFSFTLDKTEKSLLLKFPEINKNGYRLFNSPKDIILIKIENNDISKKYGYGNYTISSITKLPYYLIAPPNRITYSIIAISKEGELFIEKSQKVMNEILHKEEIVINIIKISPNELYDLKDQNMEIINLGIFPKDKITFSK